VKRVWFVEDFDTPLTVYTKEEWRAIILKLYPHWTDEYFDEVWERFVDMKRRMELH